MIGDDIAAALPTLQAQAESMMTDTCKITAVGTTQTDPDTGALIIVDGPELYTGICKQQQGNTAPRAADVNDSTVTTLLPEIHIPASAPTVTAGSVVEILTSRNRPDSVGRRVRVLAPHVKTWQTAQRLPVEETL